ncbi:Dabb family protein [Serratia nevei]|uniref:Dabb family protein n=1 Tax=Serratia nevei TaxID=2703794 RepID=UPI00313CA591
MICHFLFIMFIDTAISLQANAVREVFLFVSLKIVGVLCAEWGDNDSQERKNAGFMHRVQMTFRDEDARQRYLSHQMLEVLKTIFTPLIRNVIVLDPPVLQGNSARQLMTIRKGT